MSFKMHNALTKIRSIRIRNSLRGKFKEFTEVHHDFMKRWIIHMKHDGVRYLYIFKKPHKEENYFRKNVTKKNTE